MITSSRVRPHRERLAEAHAFIQRRSSRDRIRFAIQSTLTGYSERANDQIQRNLATSRGIVGQAKGMFLQSYNMNSGNARLLLKRLSEEITLSVAQDESRSRPETTARAVTGLSAEQHRQMIRDATRC